MTIEVRAVNLVRCGEVSRLRDEQFRRYSGWKFYQLEVISIKQRRSFRIEFVRCWLEAHWSTLGGRSQSELM